MLLIRLSTARIPNNTDHDHVVIFYAHHGFSSIKKVTKNTRMDFTAKKVI